MNEDDIKQQLKMDPADLYREENYSDRTAGSIRRLVPIKPDGADDGAREVVFQGQTQLMTPMGALPIQFEIEAANIGEAAEKFAGAAEVAVQETLQELQEMRREAASSLVVPGQGGGMGGLGGGMPGGGLGGGGLQMP